MFTVLLTYRKRESTTMNIFDFIERFPNEEECLTYFIETRQKTGTQCQKCGCMKNSWLAGIDRFVCKKCGNQFGIKSGTLMENSKLPIKHWFIAIQLLTSSDDNFSIAEIQEKLGDTKKEQISEMLESLNSCDDQRKKELTFDQLLLACVKNEHPT